MGEAAARSERLLTALEATWVLIDLKMMSERPLPASGIEQVVNEVMIRELTRIILDTEGSLARSREEAEAILARAEAERAELKSAAARRDYTRAKEPAADALQALGFHASPDPDTRQRLYARTFFRRGADAANPCAVQACCGRSFWLR
jgi:hypothetical protein